LVSAKATAATVNCINTVSVKANVVNEILANEIRSFLVIVTNIHSRIIVINVHPIVVSRKTNQVHNGVVL
jgi:hypothetical protein